MIPHLINAASTYTCGDVDSPCVPISGVAKDIINAVLGLAGSLSVIFVIIGGFKYVTSTGDPQKLSSAKQTITYALVGLGISVLAFAIVAYVLKTI